MKLSLGALIRDILGCADMTSIIQNIIRFVYHSLISVFNYSSTLDCQISMKLVFQTKWRKLTSFLLSKYFAWGTFSSYHTFHSIMVSRTWTTWWIVCVAYIIITLVTKLISVYWFQSSSLTVVFFKSSNWWFVFFYRHRHENVCLFPRPDCRSK